MGLVRPDSAVAEGAPKWTEADNADFEWRRPSGQHMESCEVYVFLPNGGGVFSVACNDTSMGPMNQHVRNMRFHDPSNPDRKIDSHEQIKANDFKTTDAAKLSIQVGSLTLTTSNPKEGFQLKEDANSVKCDLTLVPECPPVRIGTGKTQINDSHYLQRAFLPRCKVTGTLQIKGNPVNLDGAVGDVMHIFGTMGPRDMVSGGRFMRVHGPTTSVFTIDQRLIDKFGSGYLTETFTVCGSKVVASTEPTLAGHEGRTADFDSKVKYQAYHPVKTAEADVEFDVGKNAEMIHHVDMMARMPFLVRKAVGMVMGNPHVFELYAKELPMNVQGTSETGSAHVLVRVMA